MISTVLVILVVWITSGSYAVGRKYRKTPKPLLKRASEHSYHEYTSNSHNAVNAYESEIIWLYVLGPIGLVAQQFFYMGHNNVSELDDGNNE